VVLVAGFSLILAPSHSSATPFLSGTTTFDDNGTPTNTDDVTVQYSVFAPGMQTDSVFDADDKLFDILVTDPTISADQNIYFYKLTNKNPDRTIVNLMLPKADDDLPIAGEIIGSDVDKTGITIGTDNIIFPAPLPGNSDGSAMRIFYVASLFDPIHAGQATIRYDIATWFITGTLNVQGSLPAPLAAPQSVPEPGTLILVSFPLIGLWVLRRRWKRRYY